MSEVTGQAAEPLLEARDIKKYFGAITALNGVSFHVAPARCSASSATTAPASRR